MDRFECVQKFQCASTVEASEMNTHGMVDRVCCMFMISHKFNEFRMFRFLICVRSFELASLH